MDFVELWEGIGHIKADKHEVLLDKLSAGGL